MILPKKYVFVKHFFEEVSNKVDKTQHLYIILIKTSIFFAFFLKI